MNPQAGFENSGRFLHTHSANLALDAPAGLVPEQHKCRHGLAASSRACGCRSGEEDKARSSPTQHDNPPAAGHLAWRLWLASGSATPSFHGLIQHRQNWRIALGSTSSPPDSTECESASFKSSRSESSGISLKQMRNA